MHEFMDGRLVDTIIYALTRERWEEIEREVFR